MEKIEKIIEEEIGDVLTYEEKRELGIEEDFISEEKIKELREKFKEMGPNEINNILGLTIKNDDTNKLITFLAFITAYTEDNQLNISFNSPSSTGKSYIPLEISTLFPKEDIMKVGYSSPTAFFHDKGEFKKEIGEYKEIGGYLVNLSRKILIFLDQPHQLLLQHLRPLLSHDEKEITLKITDKTQKFGLKTKNVIIKGFPVVVFCSAGLKIDEQESTRFILLSPEISEEKIMKGIELNLEREKDREKYIKSLEENPERNLLKQRILEIKNSKIKNVIFEDKELINFCIRKKLQPRDMRDIKKIVRLIKAFALLNFFWREIKERNIVANEEDIKNGIELWGKISFYQEKGLPPYIYNFYKDVIVGAYNEKNNNTEEDEEKGLTINEILQSHYRIYETSIPEWKLKREILPMLSMAGLIKEEKSPEDKRQKLIYPLEEIK